MNNLRKFVSSLAVMHDGHGNERRLTDEECALMAEIEAFGMRAEELIDKVRSFHTKELSEFTYINATLQQRELQAQLTGQGQHWRMRATDDLQDGLMKLKRAVIRPLTFS